MQPKLKPAPHPWRADEHQGKGLRIVAADGSTVGMCYYPKTPVEKTTLRLLLHAPVLFERMKSIVAFCAGLKMFNVEGKDNPTLVSAQQLIRDVEDPLPPDHPKPKEVL